MATVHLVGSKQGWVLDGDAPVDLRARLGQWLRRAREARGLTVAAVAAETKISQRHLEALERGDASGLPAFYQRAEIRTVAHAVGVDEQLALTQLEAALEPAEPTPASPAMPATPATAVRAEYVLAAVAGVLTVALLGWALLDRSPTSERRGATPQLTAAAQAPSLEEPATVMQIQEATTITPVIGEPPPAGTPTTELVITTLPEGARVTVNGIAWGASPLTIRHLEPGDKHIRATKDGYAAGESSVTIDEGARRAIRIRLVEGGL